MVVRVLAVAWLPFALTLFVFLAAYGIRFLAYHAIRRWSKTHASYLASAIQFALIVGGLYGEFTYLGVNPTVILAVIAIFTAGISLASDQAMGNAIAGAVILANGKFSVGDQVTLGDVTGVITEMGFANIAVSVNTQGIVSIPNSAITGSTVINHSRAATVDMTILLPFHDDHDRKKAKVLIEEVLALKGLGTGAKILHDWTSGGEQWAVVVKVGDYGKRREIMSALSVALSDNLLSAGFPLGAVTYYREVRDE